MGHNYDETLSTSTTKATKQALDRQRGKKKLSAFVREILEAHVAANDKQDPGARVRAAQAELNAALAAYMDKPKTDMEKLEEVFEGHGPVLKRNPSGVDTPQRVIRPSTAEERAARQEALRNCPGFEPGPEGDFLCGNCEGHQLAHEDA